MEIKEITQALITRFCHDLIGPMGTAQMALEADEKQILENTVNGMVLKLDAFRTFFKDSINQTTALTLLKNIAKESKIDLIIDDIPKEFFALAFFITQKMLKKSQVTIKNDEIELNYIFLHDDEIEILENKNIKITSGTIFPFLALLQYKNYYKIEVKQLEEQNWKMKIIKI